MTLKTGIEKLTIHKNQLFCLSPNEFRKWLKSDKKNQFHNLYFSADFFNASLINSYQLNQSNIFSPLSPIAIDIEKKDKKLILEFFDILKKLIGLENEEAVRSQLHVLFHLYTKIIKPTQTDINTRPVEITQEFKFLVKNHHTDLIRVSEYAKLLKITPKHLSQMVKDTTGITAGELIEKIRFEEAKKMLANNDISIQQVAEKLKFSDQSAFGKFFKRHYGESPLQFKKSKQ